MNERLQGKRVKIIQYQNLLIKEKIDNENSLHALKKMVEKYSIPILIISQADSEIAVLRAKEIIKDKSPKLQKKQKEVKSRFEFKSPIFQKKGKSGDLIELLERRSFSHKGDQKHRTQARLRHPQLNHSPSNVSNSEFDISKDFYYEEPSQHQIPISSEINFEASNDDSWTEREFQAFSKALNVIDLFLIIQKKKRK